MKIKTSDVLAGVMAMILTAVLLMLTVQAIDAEGQIQDERVRRHLEKMAP